MKRSSKILLTLFSSFLILLILWFIFFPVDKTEWIMPKELNEISGISFINDHTLACVQDEKGIIFLYDLHKSKIVRQIPFAGKGDYEGIAVANKAAYIVTGDGIFYEVQDFLTTPKINSWELNLKEGEESEAICYDALNNRLLLAFKNHKKSDVTPELVAFNLTTKKLADSVALKVNLNTSVIRKKDRDKFKKLWEPADLAIDPDNRKIYVIDAINGHLLLLSATGELEKVTDIDKKKVSHPEGIAINAFNSIYICNDANNEGKGKIVLLSHEEK